MSYSKISKRNFSPLKEKLSVARKITVPVVSFGLWPAFRRFLIRKINPTPGISIE